MAWLRDPTPAGLCVYLTLLSLLSAIVVLMASPTRAEAPADMVSDQTAQVDAMISHLVKSVPRHPMTRPKWRRKMAEQVVVAANKREIPVVLVTAISFRESSFRWDVVGPGGELGLMQVHPFTVRKFKCDMSTIAGQLDCGCEVLAWHHDRCGLDWEAALAAYGSRRAECDPKKGTKLRGMVRNRFALARKLKEIANQ